MLYKTNALLLIINVLLVEHWWILSYFCCCIFIKAISHKECAFSMDIKANKAHIVKAQEFHWRLGWLKSLCFYTMRPQSLIMDVCADMHTLLMSSPTMPVHDPLGSGAPYSPSSTSLIRKENFSMSASSRSISTQNPSYWSLPWKSW